MPEIPEGKYRPCIEETMIDLLESVALEEIAIGHVLNAEGEKLQAILGKYRCDQINFCEMMAATKGVNRMVEDLIMKEWLLLTKLRYVGDFVQSNDIHFSCNVEGGHANCGCQGKEDTVPACSCQGHGEDRAAAKACPPHENAYYPWTPTFQGATCCYPNHCYQPCSYANQGPMMQQKGRS